MKAINFISIFLFFHILLIGCSASRFQKKGKIINENFTAEIPFQYKQDVIIVEVEIEGKNYNFMWDTGAELNVIDQSIADEINIPSIKSTSIKGSDNTSQKMGRLAIPRMKIGSLVVEESMAVISDFSSISRFLGCLELKGILGNNIMHRANMQIDYAKNIITMTDHEQVFTHSENAHKVTMNAGKIGNIKLKMIIGDHEKLLTFDTGYGGKIKTGSSELKTRHPHIRSHGITGASLHKVNTGTLTEVFIDSGTLAGIPFENQVISIKEGGASLVGNEFLKNFVITADWTNDLLIFDPIAPMAPDTIQPFELSLVPDFNSNKIEVAKIYKDYSSFNEDLIGWQVDKINGDDVGSFNQEEICDYWSTLKNKLKNMDRIELHISKAEETQRIEAKRVLFDHSILVEPVD